jgi:osmotically-inducible protein OsmY
VKAVITSTLALLIASSIVPAVHAQTDSRAADQQIASNVRSTAARNGVSLSHVFVFSRSGVVTMVGWVPEHDQVALAERSATSVDGVTSVNNWLARGR